MMSSGPRSSSPGRVVAVSVAVAALYFGYAGQIASSELITGGVVLILTASLFVVLQRPRTRDLSLRPAWGRLLGHTFLALCKDTAEIASALGRAAWRGAEATGVITLQPFEPGSDTPEASGRRALVTLANSLAPNGYVLRILEQREALALHRLTRRPPDPDREWPL